MSIVSDRPQRQVRWRLFFIVWLGAILGVIGILPYSLATQQEALADVPLPLPAVIALSMVQSGVLLAIVTAAGLWFGGRVGLGLPYIATWLDKKPLSPSWRSDFGLAFGLGLLSPILLIGLELALFMPAMERAGLAFAAEGEMAPWQAFLASFYGGITEEVLLRLFLMSFVVWLLGLLSGWRYNADEPSQMPKSWVFWVAVVVATVLFGLGHLPATAALGVPLNGLIVTRAIVLNGIAGIFFGWLYWQRGLESAIVAHFTADIILHVITPLFL